MKAEDIVCFKCTHFNPSMDNAGEEDEWISSPCSYSGFICVKCRDYKERREL